MDFAYLKAQTFGDAALEAELLRLFLAQASRLVPSLPQQPGLQQQADVAHLLKGSARAVGATALAAALEAFEAAAAEDRVAERPPFVAVLAAFASAERAIEAHLAALRADGA